MTSKPEPEPGLTRNAFLGGRLQIWQPVSGYRAGVDPVFLAAAVPARPGQSVLELGCGVGVASLALGRRVGELDQAGLEILPEYADLARRNARENGIRLAVETGDLADMPAALKSRRFEHVLANPPYFLRRNGTGGRNTGRRTARVEDVTPLPRWTDAAARRLVPGGTLTLIQNADRLADVLAACDARWGDLRILPLASRAGRSAALFLLRARKGARGPLRLLAPMTLHRGDRHERDGDSYTEAVRGILRDGAAMPVDWS